ncbi:MAG TPA: VTT domain-containing protein [Terracidiphilus sp.]|nr:VTT domain-containing protein [Terracidiphilus sp.]
MGRGGYAPVRGNRPGGRVRSIVEATAGWGFPVQSKVNAFIAQSLGSSRVRHSSVPRWLAHLGMPGLFLVAALDSSVIPLPIPGTTDLLLLWLVSHHGNAWALAACAVGGSLSGGYLTWKLGNSGGEAALDRWVPKRFLERTKRWARGHGVLAIFVSAILPPPIPLSPFLLAAGALKIPVRRFLVVFGSARALRYGLIAWLGVTYGRRVTRLWSATLERWSAPLAWTFGIVVVGGILYGFWRFRRRERGAGHQAGVETAASRGD